MAKRAVLAVAGSGKTHHLCESININERNIIIAYTNENIKNIIKELLAMYKCVPEHTLVMTFHSFIYKFMIRPFDPWIGEYYGEDGFVSDGISILAPPKSYKFDPRYRTVDTLGHYLAGKKYYCSHLSKLIVRTKAKTGSLIDMGCDNLNRFFDGIYIDEMQDFREDDWKLLTEIIKRVNNILLVGDYYQHSVSAVNNHGTPFKNCKTSIGYSDYVALLESLDLEVDEASLIKSRRCSKPVCQFVTDKLGIKMESTEDHTGKVHWLKTREEIIRILNDRTIMKLVWNMPESYNFNAIAWSYSKGDTYDSTCIILTKVYSELDSEDFVLPKSAISINKLYVALTRSKGDVYIVEHSDFESVYTKIS